MTRFKTTHKTAALSEKRVLAQSLLEGEGPVFVMGRNKYAEYVSSVLGRYDRSVSAYVDDFTEDKSFMGKPVISSEDIPDGLVVSCVVDGRPLTALNRLRTCGVLNIIDYFSLVRLEPQLFPPPEFCENNRRDIEENERKYLWLRGILEDPLSLRTLDSIVAFRYSFDLDFMTWFAFKTDEQYFEMFLKRGDEEIFVDGGGFDGKTSEQFVLAVHGYDKIYFFEPSIEMLNIAKERLSQYPRIKFAQKCLYDRKAMLTFDATKGSTSSISSLGNDIVEAVCLDDIITDKISFVKLDIEGSEVEALKGSEKTIVKYRPKIAVAVYHNQEHFWKIPEYLLSLDKTYKVHLRHYTEGILETVMYFV